MLVEARRYRIALQAHLRNGGSLAEIRAATSCSREDIDKLMSGRYGLITGGRAKRVAELLPEREREWVEEAPSWPIQVGQVPCSLIVPVIAESFERIGRLATATACQTMERHLFAISAGEREGVRFVLADRVVSRLIGPDWWIGTAERKRWYWGHDRVFGKQAQWERRRQAERVRRRVPVAA